MGFDKNEDSKKLNEGGTRIGGNVGEGWWLGCKWHEKWQVTQAEKIRKICEIGQGGTSDPLKISRQHTDFHVFDQTKPTIVYKYHGVS